MQRIAEWLEKLGMSEYERCFAENRVDFSVLHDLTDQDLKDLGIVLGDRRKMLRAIGELPRVSIAATAPSMLVAAQPVQSDSAERRQLTLMFCDLVGSTALSARLDPEDVRGIIRSYQRCCTELVERNGGFVARYMGDGMLAYFGYPQAHEHDAERAVLAGPTIVDAVPKLDAAAGSPLQVRVAIATGLVVVGDLIGSGEAQERAVTGDVQRACRQSPSQIQSLSPTAPEDFSAISSNWRISGRGASKASRDQREPGWRFGRVQWQAASRQCIRLA